MEMLLTTLGFFALTALTIWLHLRRTETGNAAAEGGQAPAGPPCPRCGAASVTGAAFCPGCGVPQQLFEIVSAPEALPADPAEENGAAPLRALVRADQCVGCGGCVHACPEPGAITMRGKLAVVDAGRCKGHGECATACPVGAITMNRGEATNRVVVPHVDANFQTNVPGLYIVGELGGRGLIKNAVNEGKVAVEHVARLRRADATGEPSDDASLDLVVVGSGPAGLSAGLEALRRGLRYVVLEQGSIADTVRKYPRHKLLLAEPVHIPLHGDLWVADASKETLIGVWESIVANTGLDVRTGQRVERIERDGDVFVVHAGEHEHRARHVVLALGRRGTPRRLGVPGEELAKVVYDIAEMEDFAGRRVLVVGGGDSAIESALGLANQAGTTVTLSYRGDAFARIKDRNREKIDRAIAESRVDVLLRSHVREIHEDVVLLDCDGGPRILPNDDVIVRVGGEPPAAFLERLGVRMVTKALPALIAVVLLMVVGLPAHAQLSPGPLARPHASLEGVRSCTRCHGGRDEPITQRCIGCHEELGWLRARGRGLHAREGKGECASCHPEHAGRDFSLIRWPDGSPEQFDHDRAGWALEDSHATAACSDCHVEKLRVSPAARLSPRTTGAGWVGLESSCRSCHDDPHRGALDARCETCHDARDWKEPPRFDHAKTRYPLTGRHQRVDCEGCHLAARLRPKRDAGGKPIPVYAPLEFGDCATCHTDPHRGRLRGACSSCHTTSGFAELRRGAFDHDRTRYPLRGSHVRVTCASCHGAGAAERPTPAFGTCASCHADPHAGEATLGGARVDCASCHRVEGFEPSTYPAARHAATHFPLDGKHASAACAGCHVSRTVAGRREIEMRPASGSCADCHVDPHGRALGTAGPGCIACHDANGFAPSSVDVAAHARFAFALEGAHRAVPCVTCHRELQRPEPATTLLHAGARPGTRAPRAPLGFRVPLDRGCESCHESPHGNQFTDRGDRGACTGCHTQEAFVPASRFDHARETRFPLEQGHAGVACASCHRPSAPGGMIRYAISPRCESCHGS